MNPDFLAPFEGLQYRCHSSINLRPPYILMADDVMVPRGLHHLVLDTNLRGLQPIRIDEVVQRGSNALLILGVDVAEWPQPRWTHDALALRPGSGLPVALSRSKNADTISAITHEIDFPSSRAIC